MDLQENANVILSTINPETFDESSSSKSQVSINSRVRQLDENSFAQRLGVTGHGSYGEIVNLTVFQMANGSLIQAGPARQIGNAQSLLFTKRFEGRKGLAQLPILSHSKNLLDVAGVEQCL